MKRIYLIVLSTVFLTTAGVAQKQNNMIGFGGDLGLPTGEFGDMYKMGIGFYSKGMLAVGKAGHVTLTAGYSGFKQRPSWEGFTSTLSMIPVMLGYRHNFDGFFIEPQAGYAVLGVKFMNVDDETFTDASGVFVGAATVGYVFNKQIEVSARYQTGGRNGSNLSLFGVRVGYNFSLGSSK